MRKRAVAVHADAELLPHRAAVAVGCDQIVGNNRRLLSRSDIAQHRPYAPGVLLEVQELGPEPDVRAMRLGITQEDQLDPVLPGGADRRGRQRFGVDITGHHHAMKLAPRDALGNNHREIFGPGSSGGGQFSPRTRRQSAQHGTARAVPRHRRMALDQKAADAAPAQQQRRAQSGQPATNDKNRNTMIPRGHDDGSCLNTTTMLQPNKAIYRFRHPYR